VTWIGRFSTWSSSGKWQWWHAPWRTTHHARESSVQNETRFQRNILSLCNREHFFDNRSDWRSFLCSLFRFGTIISAESSRVLLRQALSDCESPPPISWSAGCVHCWLFIRSLYLQTWLTELLANLPAKTAVFHRSYCHSTSLLGTSGSSRRVSRSTELVVGPLVVSEGVKDTRCLLTSYRMNDRWLRALMKSKSFCNCDAALKRFRYSYCDIRK